MFLCSESVSEDINSIVMYTSIPGASEDIGCFTEDVFQKKKEKKLYTWPVLHAHRLNVSLHHPLGRFSL